MASFLAIFLLLVFSPQSVAQNNTNSPYSRYGLGDISYMGSGNTRAMGGVALGLRAKNQINYLNPASYTSIDSLTFNFEGSYSVQNTNFSLNGVKRNAKNSTFDMMAMQFRFGKWAAMSLGMVPLSNIGYNLYNGYEDATDSNNNYMVTNSGEGGLHKVYAGLGFKVLKDLSIGVNLNYVWGNVKREINQNYLNNTSALSFTRASNTRITGVNLDFGLQYTKRIGRVQYLTLGAVFSPKMGIKSRMSQSETLGNESMGYTSTDVDSLMTTETPMKIGVGLAYVYDNRLTIAADYVVEQWDKVTVMDQRNSLGRRQRISLGAEYQHNPYGSFLQKIKFRAGLYSETPYYRFDGATPYKEYGVTAGLCVPLGSTNSLLHISGQYARQSAKSDRFIGMNTLRLSLGVTFNERWFFKRLVY